MKNVTFLLLTLIFLLLYCSQENRVYDPEKEYRIAELQEDFYKLTRTLEKDHPSLHIYHNKRTFDSYADSVFAQIDNSMTAKDFYILLSRLVEKVNCGHTHLTLPEAYWQSANALYKYFPLKLFFQDKRGYVLRNYSRDSTCIPGSQILSVNGIPMSSIIDNFHEIISSDGLNQTYKYAKMNRIDYGLFPGYPEVPDTYHITYMTPEDSVEMSTTIEAETHEVILSARNRQGLQTIPFRQYDLEMSDSLGTAILTIRDFVPDVPDEYVDFLKNGFQKIHEAGIQNVIIDVRDNDGGGPNHAAELLSYLTDVPYAYFHRDVIGYPHLKRPVAPHPLNFPGNVYVLIDGGCFSTTGHLLSLIKFHDLGTLIGEETGGSFRCYGCPKECILPHTKLRLQYMRCSYSAKVEELPWDSGVTPDVEVKPLIEDIIRGKDTIKEYTLGFIKKKRNMR